MKSIQTPSIKIALIEDDQAIQEMYGMKLRHEGFTVQMASDGQAGLKLIETFKPDLILLDIRMPIMNGVEMLIKLRSRSWGASARVIVLTNISRDEAPSELRLLNVDRYIVKAHHTPSQVISIIKEVLTNL